MGGNIILVGFMGAGKSSIGKRLAKRLGLKLVDLDWEIEKLLKMPIHLIFKRHGVIRFRSEEELMLVKVCREQGQIIATGGGIVLKETNRRFMAGAGTVIWLEAGVEQIMLRVGLGKGRPLLKGKDVREVISRLLAERHKLYADVADYIVSTDQKSIDQVVGEIIKMLKDEKDELGRNSPDS